MLIGINLRDSIFGQIMNQNGGRDFAMGTAVTIRQNYTADDLRRLSRRSCGADWARRLLALSVIYESGSRGQAAYIGGVGLQIIHDWVERFNLRGFGRSIVSR
ncbi:MULTISPECIES: hypothetical protein [unclassified Rhizobium]|uniref:hypothetical protein n=1 Tax=unclassified Rhizobium TaxID=2613769 RepID=UPI000701A063|nr:MULTISPECIES: hypothetical protein [unclassified Rhizobium]KQV36318.1 hypothetical protein ASC86_24835 [Rhizobium sp. Root1212]KRD26262.1 hypothetical protein ASE37_24750 [Rhizobium sp. Root268]